jgi:hypothetical protein
MSVSKTRAKKTLESTKRRVPMTPRIPIIGLVFLVSCYGVQSADAQDNRLYAGVSGMVSTQGSANVIADPDAPYPGVSGTAFGVAGEFGIFLLPPRVHEWTFSLSFEFSLPARFESVQATDYYFVSRTDNRHRELVFSGLFHVHAPPSGPLHMGLVAGPSFVQEDTLQSTTVPVLVPCCQIPTNLGPFGPETQLTRWTFGLTFGADIGIQVSRLVQIVPQIRLHWADRADFSGDASSAFLNLSPWLIRPAVGVRVGF